MAKRAPSKTRAQLCAEAKSFASKFSAEMHPELAAITDGKGVGTYIESRFKTHLRARGFFVVETDEGNAAKGIDLPRLKTDIKVTSLAKPQSSAPFKDFRQKVEGLGYNLIVFVYVKTGTGAKCRVNFPSVRFIPARLTGDHQTTKYLRQLVSDNETEVEDVLAYLQDRQIPAEETALREYAEALMQKPPKQGYCTISNALQWRLSYTRVVTKDIPGIHNVLTG